MREPTIESVVRSAAPVMWKHRATTVRNDSELVALASEFREAIIADRGSPVGMCACVSQIIESFLCLAKGCDVRMVQGEVFGAHHAWLEFPDGRILDATGDQFNSVPMCWRLPPVYLGARPDYYATASKEGVK